jgi:hypothetical protein
MSRQRFIQDRVTGKLIPAEEYYARDEVKAPMVMNDIQPYRSMIDGRMITSRSTHREHLKSHGCVEVGNDWKQPERKVDPSAGLKRRIAEIVNSRL